MGRVAKQGSASPKRYGATVLLGVVAPFCLAGQYDGTERRFEGRILALLWPCVFLSPGMTALGFPWRGVALLAARLNVVQLLVRGRVGGAREDPGPRAPPV